MNKLTRETILYNWIDSVNDIIDEVNSNIKDVNIDGKDITITKTDGTTSTLTTQDTVYTLPTATSSVLGGVKIGSNITNSSGKISLTKDNVTSALGYTPPTQDTVYTLPTATSSVLGGVKVGSNISVSSGTISLTKANVTDALGYTPPQQDTTYSNMTAATSSAAGKAGLVPAPGAGKQTSFLRGDGTWVVPTNTTYSAATSDALGLVKVGSNITNSSGTISLTKTNVTDALGYTPPTTNTTYSNMTAATSSAAGKAGLVPAPAAGAQAKFLRGDGTWQTPTDNKVAQTVTTTNSTYPILLSATANRTATATEGARFSSKVKVNASTGSILASQFHRLIDTVQTATTVISGQSPLATTVYPIIQTWEGHAADDDSSAGLNVAFGSKGSTFIGSGESLNSLISEQLGNASENIYNIADNSMYFYTGANTYANKKLSLTLDASGNATINNHLKFGNGAELWIE